MVNRIEDLLVWQKSRLLCKEIYQVVKLFPSIERSNLVSQLIRAANSVCANIAEGFGRYNPQESIQFYRTARGSLMEVKSHLYVAYDQEYIEEKQLKDLCESIEEATRMLNGFIKTTRSLKTTRPITEN